MNPFALGTRKVNPELRPVNQMVFAFASTRSPSVTLVNQGSLRQRARGSAGQPLVSYDFWFAGIGPETFGCVAQEEVQHYKDLFTSSRSIYKVADSVDPNLLSQERWDRRTIAAASSSA